MRWDYLLGLTAVLGARYFIIAGIAFLLFYILFRQRFAARRIQPRFPKSKDYGREVGYSILTILIFAAVPTLLLFNPLTGPHTTVYFDMEQHGLVYYWLAFPLMAVMHDTYFYWTHRLMHHPKLFRIFHLVHHRSVNPSPWAAYAFHPLEAFVEVGIFAVFIFTIPMHVSHLVLFFLFMIIYNVYGHLGYELYPKWFNRNGLSKWINTSVAHNMHHEHFKGNYGLYFTFWDRVMGTLHSDYDRRFEEVTTAQSNKAPEAKTVGSGELAGL